MKQISSIKTLALLLFITHSGTNLKSQPTTQIKTTDSMTFPARMIHVSINQTADKVYAFASNPENFPKWVQFVTSISNQGKYWLGKTDLGNIRIKFTPHNLLGVIDHEVTLVNGQTVNNPMRVIPNHKGCEFIFTLFWMPGRTQDEYNNDAQAVMSDLLKLKEIMERNQGN